MTQISRDDVLKLASLSSLQLNEGEVSDLQADILAVLEYVKQLDELDTADVRPAYQVTGLKNVLRQDTIEASSVSREELLKLSPVVLDNQIKVPKVL